MSLFNIFDSKYAWDAFIMILQYNLDKSAIFQS